VTLPLREELTTATLMGMCAEALNYHRGDLRTRWAEYGAPTRLAIAGAIAVTAADYLQIQRVRRVGIRALAALFEDVDVIITPTCNGPAPVLADLDWDGLISLLNTPYWNAVGHPAVSIPCGYTSGGMPVGLQIAGRPFDEATVLKVADAFQGRTDHHLRVPSLDQEVSA